MIKNQKGVTLIALVITIIVLLILAGVSIAMLTGENGLLTKASGAKEKTRIAEIAEYVQLGIASAYANSVDPNDGTAFNIGSIATEVTSSSGKITTGSGQNLTLVDGSTTYTIVLASGLRSIDKNADGSYKITYN